jgi:hypothetical protein
MTVRPAASFNYQRRVLTALPHEMLLRQNGANGEGLMVKGFGRRPQHDRWGRSGAGVRKPPKEETAVRKGAGAVRTIYGDLRVTDCRGRPFGRGLIEHSRDLVVEGRLWRRGRDRF